MWMCIRPYAINCISKYVNMFVSPSIIIIPLNEHMKQCKNEKSEESKKGKKKFQKMQESQQVLIIELNFFI